MSSKITNDTWDKENRGETTDSNNFFLAVLSGKQKLRKKEI